MDTRTRTRSDSGIELTIDKLVLHGFPRSARHDVAEAMERELERLFSERGAPFREGMSLAKPLEVGAIELTEHATPASIGRQIARSLYEGMERCTPG
jgi:hypothetical protein